MPLSSLFDALLLDLDGTVWSGDVAIDGAVDAISGSGLPALYITNNASRSPWDVAAKLRAHGLPANAADVVTSAQAAVVLAGKYLDEGDPVLVVGAPSFRELVARRATGWSTPPTTILGWCSTGTTLKRGGGSCPRQRWRLRAARGTWPRTWTRRCRRSGVSW